MSPRSLDDLQEGHCGRYLRTPGSGLTTVLRVHRTVRTAVLQDEWEVPCGACLFAHGVVVATLRGSGTGARLIRSTPGEMCGATEEGELP